MKTIIRRLAPVSCALALLVHVPLASAFVIQAQLTGDIRLANPDNLFVNVTITTTSATTANWLIDINAPLHPNIRLDEFYFNLAGLSSNYSFSGFNPSQWSVNSPASVQGAGGATFQFETVHAPGNPNIGAITNAQDLTFLMTSLQPLTPDTFLLAPVTISNDAGSGQLGAHLQSLSPTAPATSDSGFAFGNFVCVQDCGAIRPSLIPEPSSLALIGITLLAFAGLRRKKA